MIIALLKNTEKKVIGKEPTGQCFCLFMCVWPDVLSLLLRQSSASESCQLACDLSTPPTVNERKAKLK
jgi:hypothetical protein